MMKHFFFAGLFFLMPAANTNAQLRFGVKGGMNVTSVKFDKHIVDPENRIGFLAGPVIEIMLPLVGCGIDAALLYTQKGFGVNDQGFNNDYLELPVNLKWKINLPLVAPYAAVGPYAGICLTGGKQWDVNDLYDHIKGRIENRSFSAGLNFSVGAEVLQTVQLGLNYSWELTDNYQAFEAGNSNAYTGKNHLWSLSATFFF